MIDYPTLLPTVGAGSTGDSIVLCNRLHVQAKVILRMLKSSIIPHPNLPLPGTSFEATQATATTDLAEKPTSWRIVSRSLHSLFPHRSIQRTPPF